MGKIVKTLDSSLSLCMTSVEIARQEHLKEYGFYPTTLGIPPADTQIAYEIMTERKLGMVIVPIPGLPDGMWFVSSPHGMIYSGLDEYYRKGV